MISKRFGCLLVSCLCASLVPAPAPAAPPEQADDQPLQDYTVRAGDTCAGIARRLYGNPGRTDLIHKKNDLGPEPHRLRQGQVLQVPVSAGPDARLTFVRNQVLADTPERHAAQRNEPLARGNQIETLGRSSAEVTFSDDTQIQIGQLSQLLLLGDPPGQKARFDDTALLRGTLRAQLAAPAPGQAPPLVVLATPSGKVRFGAGEGQLTVDDAGSTRVAVYRGKWRLRAQGREVVVPEGFGSRADGDRPPTPPQPLPAAPTWQVPPPTLVLFSGSPPEVSGTFAPAEGPGPGKPPQVAAFHVQVSRDERFNDLHVDSQVPASSTRLVARVLLPGVYFARVSAIDADHFEGPAGQVARIEVAQARVLPGGGGRAARVEVPAGLLCGLDGARLMAVAGPIPLAPAQAHLLRCAVAADGSGTAEFPIAPSQSRPLVVSALPEAPRPDGQRRVVLKLSDGAGGPVSATTVRVTASAGATATDVRELGEPGLYATEVRWSQPGGAVALHFEINGVESFDTVLPRVEVPAAPAVDEEVQAKAAPSPEQVAVTQSLPALPVGRGPGLELGLHAAAHVDTGNGPFGGGVGMDLLVRFPFEHGALVVGLRPGYERHDYYGGVRTPCQSSAPTTLMQCMPSGAGGFSLLRSSDLLTLALPLSYRFRGPRAAFHPYLGVAPEVLFEWARVSSSGAASVTQTARIGIMVLLGGEMRLGPGGVFAEVGYRRLFVDDPPPSDTSLSGVMLFGGYRFHL